MPIEDKLSLWSSPDSWASGKVPDVGEDAIIPPGKNMLYDVEDGPILNYVEINGRLTFKQDAEKLILRAKYVYVRAGELFIGNISRPFEGQAQIILYGAKL